MKFKGPGNTVVWDKERERELCRFEKGQLETEDPRTCEILVKLGYEYEGELPDRENPPAAPPEIDEELEALKIRAKELKVKNWHKLKKENLVEAIAEAEKELT